MNTPVNLFKEEDIRQFTAVNKRLVVIVSAACGAGLLLLLVLALVIRTGAVKRDLEQYESRWSAMEKGYTEAKQVRDQLRENQKLIEELQGWKNARVDWNTFLSALRRTVPANMQFLRLGVRGTLERKVTGEGDQAVEELARQYRISLHGLAVGELADEVVVQFVRDLRHDEPFDELLNTVKLQGLKRRKAENQKKEWREFTIEATTGARTIQ